MSESVRRSNLDLTRCADFLAVVSLICSLLLPLLEPTSSGALEREVMLTSENAS